MSVLYPRSTYERRLGMLEVTSLVVTAVIGTAMGCSSAPAPLAIHMYNPKTHQALTCSARDPRPGADVSLLAGAVEKCAKSLETQGFVREK